MQTLTPVMRSLDSVSRLCNDDEIQSEKLTSLKRILVEKKMLKGISFRCIVFVKQRIAAYILSKYLNSDETCKDYGMKAGFLAARNSKITSSLKVTPGDFSRFVEHFRCGDINILVATAVIEEVSIATLDPTSDHSSHNKLRLCNCTGL